MRRFKTDWYEDGILNSILTWPEDHPKIFNYLQPEHFEPGLKQKLYTVLYKLYQKNRIECLSNIAMICEVCTLLETEKTSWSYLIKCLTEEAPFPTDLNFYISSIATAIII